MIFEYYIAFRSHVQPSIGFLGTEKESPELVSWSSWYRGKLGLPGDGTAVLRGCPVSRAAVNPVAAGFHGACESTSDGVTDRQCPSTGLNPTRLPARRRRCSPRRLRKPCNITLRFTDMNLCIAHGKAT